MRRIVRGDEALVPVAWGPLREEAEPETNREAVEREEEAAAQLRRTAARRNRKKKGLVIVNTGEGKGKTTAALGILTRAWGRRMKVGVVQFLKHEECAIWGDPGGGADGGDRLDQQRGRLDVDERRFGRDGCEGAPYVVCVPGENRERRVRCSDSG